MENKNNTEPEEEALDPQTSPDPLAPAENNADLSKEIDPDDVVHARKEKPSEENKQQDADDAIHKNYKPAADPLHENDEKDPDDIVHGG